jgi:hypothetical protein
MQFACDEKKKIRQKDYCGRKRKSNVFTTQNMQAGYAVES